MGRTIVRRLIRTLRLVDKSISVGLVVTHGRRSAEFTVTGGRSGTAIHKGMADCKATLEAPFDTLLQIVGMNLSLEDATAAKRAKVSGSATLVRKLPQLFDLA